MSMHRHSLEEQKRELREVERWARFALETPAGDWTTWTLAHAMQGGLDLVRAIRPETLPPLVARTVTTNLQETLERLDGLHPHRRRRDPLEDWRGLDEVICSAADLRFGTERSPEALAEVGAPLCRIIALLTPAALAMQTTDSAA
jgi:hypothetical protein